MIELWEWIRIEYDVAETEGNISPVIAYDRFSGEEVGRWVEGGRVPDSIYREYLNDVQGAKEELRKFIAEHPIEGDRYKEFL